MTETIVASIRLSDQVALVTLLLSLFSCLSHDGPLAPFTASIAVAAVTVCLSIAFLVVSSSTEGEFLPLPTGLLTTGHHTGWKFIRSAMVCLVGGITVSPILKTLTETISTDTLYAMVTVMMMMHIIFFDYGIESAIVSPPISLNAALFAAVCLASRLSTVSAFTLILFASDIFVLLTMIRKQVEGKVGPKTRTTFSSLVVVVSVAAVLMRTMVVRISYLCLILLLNLVFPYCFYKLQVMKE